MKEQYIKQVERALHVPCKAKREIVRDLNEILHLPQSMAKRNSR